MNELHQLHFLHAEQLPPQHSLQDLSLQHLSQLTPCAALSELSPAKAARSKMAKIFFIGFPFVIESGKTGSVFIV
jgi:hypothetical protein